MSNIAETLSLLDKHTPDPVLARIGLAPSRVRVLASALAPLTAEEARRAAARVALRTMPKGCWEGERLPDQVVRAMYADYLQTRSTPAVGKIYGRSATAVQTIFRRRGLKVGFRAERPAVEYRGRVWHLDNSGRYYRVTVGRRVLFLHKVVWEDANGPVPAGHMVTFLNGDNHDLSPENLVCLSRAEVSSLHRRRVLAQKAAA